MSLTLLQAEANARTLTRHDADSRFSQDQYWVWANEEYRRIRSWLRQEAVCPEFALLTSEQTVGVGGSVILSAVNAGFEGLHLVEVEVSDDHFRAMERANPLQRNVNMAGGYTFREQAGVLMLGPDGLFGGTVRIHYHATPALLSDVDGVFVIPVECEQALILRTCGWIAIRDGEGAAGKKAWEDQAAALLKEALPSLRARHGIHPSRAGLHMVLGY